MPWYILILYNSTEDENKPTKKMQMNANENEMKKKDEKM